LAMPPFVTEDIGRKSTVYHSEAPGGAQGHFVSAFRGDDHPHVV